LHYISKGNEAFKRVTGGAATVDVCLQLLVFLRQVGCSGYAVSFGMVAQEFKISGIEREFAEADAYSYLIFERQGFLLTGRKVKIGYFL
jgi:hypothetical protein